MKTPRTKAQLLADPRIDELWQEDDGCFHPTRPSWWASLTPGWRWEACTTLHEATIKALCAAVEDAQPFGVCREVPGVYGTYLQVADHDARAYHDPGARLWPVHLSAWGMEASRLWAKANTEQSRRLLHKRPGVLCADGHEGPLDYDQWQVLRRLAWAG